MTVVALGDSLTAGYGLPPEEGLVPQLQGWLEAAGAEVVVQNAGVSGDTTAGGLSRLDWALGADADALMVILGGNDMLRGIDPAEARGNLAAILEKARERGLPVLLVGMEAPGNYGAAYKASFDGMYAALAGEYGALLEPSLFRLMGDDLGELGALLQADGIHPNAEGVGLIVQGLGPRVVELAGKTSP
ncbi:arylesterase [Gemmobacter tilapiae]|uniref:Arylesterase n=1 Tax=Neogemmobacter tilapiae TaxID=875041 RepID=A0A918WN22_9RHOB|nr:arylesterase [Gemmobacter tilapiae]